MLNVIDVALDWVIIGGLAYVLVLLKRQRGYVASLHSDMSRPRVTPELITLWRHKIARLEPGSSRYNAYKRSLEAAGAWDGD